MKYIGIAAVAIVLLTAINACKVSSDVKDNITSAQDFSSAETQFAGAFDISDDINQSDGKIKKGSSTILPSGAIFTWVDSLYSDGNGIEYILDFGTVGSTVPYGMVCKDGKYRAGKLRIKVSAPYLQIGTEVKVIASDPDNGDAYYSGDGTNMVRVEGTLSVTRTADQELTVNITDGVVYKELDKMVPGKSAKFHGTKVIKRTAGASTPGLLGDEYDVTGNGGGTNMEGDDYTWTINTPLHKKIELGCAKTFVTGVIEIKNVTASTSLKVDFDAYKNGACDNVAKAIIGGKEIIFVVK